MRGNQPPSTEFQFLYGTIKTTTFSYNTAVILTFQFLYGTIKTLFRP